jgi:hypothetical protein
LVALCAGAYWLYQNPSVYQGGMTHRAGPDAPDARGATSAPRSLAGDARPTALAPAELARRVVEAQKQATALFPDLARSDTPLNARFVAAYHRLIDEQSPRLQDPDWPLELAAECGSALGVRPVALNASVAAEPPLLAGLPKPAQPAPVASAPTVPPSAAPAMAARTDVAANQPPAPAPGTSVAPGSVATAPVAPAPVAPAVPATTVSANATSISPPPTPASFFGSPGGGLAAPAAATPTTVPVATAAVPASGNPPAAPVRTAAVPPRAGLATPAVAAGNVPRRDAPRLDDTPPLISLSVSPMSAGGSFSVRWLTNEYGYDLQGKTSRALDLDARNLSAHSSQVTLQWIFTAHPHGHNGHTIFDMGSGVWDIQPNQSTHFGVHSADLRNSSVWYYDSSARYYSGAELDGWLVLARYKDKIIKAVGSSDSLESLAGTPELESMVAAYQSKHHKTPTPGLVNSH